MRELNDLNKVETQTTTDSLNLVNSFTNKYIVSPVLNLGIAGIVFDRPETVNINLRAQITTHYVEDNSPIQDHISKEPKRITFKGQACEVVYNTPTSNNFFQTLSENLTIANAFIPLVTASTNKILNNIKQVKEGNKSKLDSTLDNTADIYKVVKNLAAMRSRQASFFGFVQALYDARIKFGIDTPYGYIPNMVIESIDAESQPNNNDTSDFTISLIEYRSRDILYVDFDETKWRNRAVGQESTPENLGKSQGKNVPKELTSAFFNQFGKVL